jgi:hypothetical protein
MIHRLFLKTTVNGTKETPDAEYLQDLKILFVFDEARVLTSQTGKDVNPFLSMRRAAQSFPMSSGLFVLLLDTASRVSNLSPGTFYDPSARARSEKTVMFAPIYTFGTFDINKPTFQDYGQLELKAIFSPHVRYRFGRPLWSILIKMQGNFKTHTLFSR